MRFSVEASSARHSSRSILSSLYSHLRDKIDAGNVSLLTVFENVSNRISELDAKEADGARIRSRTRWAEEGESSTKFFLRLEKKRGSDSWISAMRSDDGSFATEINAICDSWVEFYSSLFSAAVTDPSEQSDVLDSLSAFLSPAQSELCEGLLPVEEARVAMEGLASGKSPGSDGLHIEFYRTFWDVLGSDLVEVFNASYCSGFLPTSQRTALIILIFKKGHRLSHKNWRPISLLNCDYKIRARALAGRLLKVLHHVIHPDQTCGVKGRFIGENVSLLRDVVQYAHETRLPLAILSLDQEKAFDRVDWECLFTTLQHMGFGKSFISWVRLLYAGVRSAVLVNGYTKQFFLPSRGVRQGCPLSPLLLIASSPYLHRGSCS